MLNRSVTIGRQYASGGREIGKLLSQKLEMPYYDYELVLLAAEKYGLNPGVLKEKDEIRTDSLLYNLAVLTSGNARNFGKVMEPYEIFQAECETIRRLSEKHPAVFIGRCADLALMETGKPLRVFIYATNMEDRIKRAHEVDHIDMKNIESYIKRKDMKRKSYYNSFAPTEWGRMETYDLCLNSSDLGYEKCAEIIAEALVE